MRLKLFIVLFVFILVSVFYFTGAHQYLELNSIQRNLALIKEAYRDSPITVLVAFAGLYVFITGLSIPGAIVLTLLSGSVFGPVQGTLLVNLCCTTGASISFLISRYLLRGVVEKKFIRQSNAINRKLVSHGTQYLLTLRMLPASPFVVINLVMGLTKMKLFTFSWMTFVGMLPGNFIFVYAGQRISKMDSPNEILTWPVIVTLTIVGLLPLFVKRILGHKEKKLEA